MTMKVGIRELARNSNILDGYDYVDVDVEDKKFYDCGIDIFTIEEFLNKQ